MSNCEENVMYAYCLVVTLRLCTLCICWGRAYTYICTKENNTNVYKNPRATAKFFIVTLGVLHKQEWITLTASVDFQPSPDNEAEFQRDGPRSLERNPSRLEDVRTYNAACAATTLIHSHHLLSMSVLYIGFPPLSSVSENSSIIMNNCSWNSALPFLSLRCSMNNINSFS